MEVLSISYKNVPSINCDICACIGYFDGIHIGHQKLVSKCIEVAKEKGLKSCMISFEPDPWVIFHPNEKIQHITPMDDRIKIADALGLDVFIQLEFTKDFAALDVSSFHNVLESLHVKHLVCGFDFKYAYKNSGDVHTLEHQSFSISVIDSINDELTKISSSRIEPTIENGDLYKANQLLGYIYSLKGIVEHGFKRGTTLLNIPTANLQYDDEYITPGVGVYAGFALVNNTFYKAMINVGKNPTFENTKQTIEGHIIDFHEDIYDQEIRFFFYKFIRPEMKFNGFEQLKEQLHKDVDTTKVVSDFKDELVQSTVNLWMKSL